MTGYQQKKIAVINDLTGYGKCALTISIPVLSSMGIACCPVPTSVFSNHTGYSSYQCRDLTENLPAYIKQWKSLDLCFDGILSGYLGSEAQMDMVADFIRTFKTRSTVVIIDPVMADHGKLYSAYTPKMCQKMKELICYADILTPNLTEACFLTGTPYKESWEQTELAELAKKLTSFGPSRIVITGIEENSQIANFCYEKGNGGDMIRTAKAGSGHHGTGDIFSSMLAGLAVKGSHKPGLKKNLTKETLSSSEGLTELLSSVRQAADFIQACLEHTLRLGVKEPEGLIFEDLLYLLHEKE